MRPAAIILSVAFAPVLAAQTFTTWTTADGLPTNDLRDLAWAPDGKLWIATAQGVAIFDGSTFSVHTTTTHPGLANNDVYAVAVGPDGIAYVGTDFGLSRYDNGAYTTYTTAQGLGGNEVKNIKVAPDGDVWICTSNGATRWSAGGFTAHGMPQIPFGGTTHAAFDGSQVLLSGGLGGLIVAEGGNFTAYTTANGLLSNRLRAVAVDAQHNRWIATAAGISVMNSANVHIGDHAHVFLLPPPDELNPITDIVVDEAGRVWAGVYVDYLVTEGGVSVYVNGGWQQFETSDGLAGPNVRRLALGGGYLWVATSTGLTRMAHQHIGMAEPAAGTGFRVFPNPASEELNVLPAGAWPGVVPVEVIDMHGRAVLRTRLGPAPGSIDVSGLGMGTYVLRAAGQQARFSVVR